MANRNLHSHHHHKVFFFSPHSHQHLLFVFINDCHYDFGEINLRVVLLCISLLPVMFKIFHFYWPYFDNYLFILLVHLMAELFEFLALRFLSSLYFGLQSDVQPLKIFSSLADYLFIGLFSFLYRSFPISVSLVKFCIVS